MVPGVELDRYAAEHEWIALGKLVDTYNFATSLLRRTKSI